MDETNLRTYREALSIILIHDPCFDPNASRCRGGLGRVVIFTSPPSPPVRRIYLKLAIEKKQLDKTKQHRNLGKHEENCPSE